MTVPRPLALAELLDQLLNCVCASIDTMAERVEGHPRCPCRIFVSPGTPPGDCCSGGCGADAEEFGHGQLVVYTSRLFQTNAFPQQNVNIDPCAPTTLAAEVVVRLARCGPGFDDRGGVPSNDQWTAAGTMVAVDMLAMVDAVSCCAVLWPGHHKKRRVAIVSHVPIAPEACVGSELRAIFDVGKLGGPPPDAGPD